MVDEVFKPVAAFGCSGEPEPVFGGYSIEDVEERAGGDVMAFVDNHETVVHREIFDVVAAGKCWQQSHIDDAGGL